MSIRRHSRNSLFAITNHANKSRTRQRFDDASIASLGILYSNGNLAETMCVIAFEFVQSAKNPKAANSQLSINGEPARRRPF